VTDHGSWGDVTERKVDDDAPREDVGAQENDDHAKPHFEPGRCTLCGRRISNFLRCEFLAFARRRRPPS